MDHRCPECSRDLASRKLSQAIIARLEIDCPYCMRRIRVNVHPAETAIIIGSFGGFALLALLGYWLDRQPLFIFAFGCAMLGAAALPLAERLWLRKWPRYASMNSQAVRNSSP